MTPHDERAFKTFIADFVTGCCIEPPFHLVMIGSNGSVSVVRYFSAENVEPVCSRIVGSGYASPVVVTVIAANGVGKSAKVEIEQAGRTLQ
jgi:hypothetical protein